MSNNLSDDDIIKLYNDPKTGLIGKSAFAKKYKIPIKRLNQILQSVDAYNLNVPLVDRFPRRHVKVFGKGNIWELDLQDLSSEPWSLHNKGYNYILCCVDEFSRYAYCEGLKSKSSFEVAAAFNNILKREDPNLNEYQQPPKIVYTDRGTEFQGAFKQLMKTLNIPIWHSTTKQKASIVERFNYTFKLRLGRLADATNSYNWIDNLQDLIYNYNNTYHTTIKMSPFEANDPENYEA